MAFRKPELDRYKQIWLTKQGGLLLRIEKKKQHKSMTRLVDDLIKNAYVKAR